MGTAVIVLQLLAQYGPAVAQMAQRLMSSKTEPTQADWDALFDKAQKPYDSYIEEARQRAEGK